MRFLIHIAMNVTLDQVQEIFLFYESSRKALGSIQPPILWLPELKRPECEADYSPASNAEAQKTADIVLLPQKAFTT